MKKTMMVLMTALSVSAASAADGDSFEGGEFSLSVFGGWVDKDDSTLAPGVGLTYFFTQHLGAGAFTHWDNFDGTFIDNISAEGYFRLPLGDMPLAPYGLVALGYSFETDETFQALGAGAEWRFQRWGVFGDVRWQFNNDTDNGVAIRAGVRIPF